MIMSNCFALKDSLMDNLIDIDRRYPFAENLCVNSQKNQVSMLFLLLLLLLLLFWYLCSQFLLLSMSLHRLEESWTVLCLVN